ncbi:MAG TPA: hypothetical protein VFI27_06170 [candidate division Zixibacteria bacterium]|nr:hypothetical protein [candidate division Zixibacteria bacterium]
MAEADRFLDISTNLTAEERRLVVQLLNGVHLRGDPASLRKALALIDSITGKLSIEPAESGNTEDSYLLP